jgi:DNA invertase Pin-like site-specific DNA recombinase
MGIDPDTPHIGLKVEKEHTGGRGRPKYVIRREQLLYLRDLRFSWTKIALLYGISRRTLYNIRFELGLAGSDHR